MPGADLVQTIWITKPAVLADILNVDCILRGVHLISKLGQLQLAPWSTPQLGSTSVTLTEHNKAEPNSQNNQRASTVLSTAWAHPIVKISFDWDPIADTYANILVLEDEIAIDDAGSVPDAFSLDAKNLTSAGIDTIAAPFFARWIPNLSRAVRILTRSISPALYEGIGVGDSALVSDSFARDPSTGARGTAARAGLIVRHRYNPGGATAGGGKPRDAAGEVDVVFLQTDRTAAYSPAAEVDETNSAGGFLAGYNAGTNTLAFHPHEHTLLAPFGGNFDVGFFKVNDLAFKKIVETDPANPARPAMRWAPVNVLSVSSLAVHDRHRADRLGHDQALPHALGRVPLGADHRERGQRLRGQTRRSARSRAPRHLSSTATRSCRRPSMTACSSRSSRPTSRTPTGAPARRWL